MYEFNTQTQSPAPQLLAFWSRGADGRLVMAWVSAQTMPSASPRSVNHRILAEAVPRAI